MNGKSTRSTPRDCGNFLLQKEDWRRYLIINRKMTASLQVLLKAVTTHCLQQIIFPNLGELWNSRDQCTLSNSLSAWRDTFWILQGVPSVYYDVVNKRFEETARDIEKMGNRRMSASRKLTCQLQVICTYARHYLMDKLPGGKYNEIWDFETVSQQWTFWEEVEKWSLCASFLSVGRGRVEITRNTCASTLATEANLNGAQDGFNIFWKFPSEEQMFFTVCINFCGQALRSVVKETCRTKMQDGLLLSFL